MAINWTKSWTSSDDGTILSGSDLENIQNNTESDTVQISGTQTITGDKTFSGVSNLTGITQFNSTAVTSSAAEINYLDGVTAIVVIPNEFCTWQDDIISYEGSLVYYR